MMERADVARLAEKLWDTFIASPPRDVWNYAIRTTSGTAGVPILFINPAPDEAFKRFRGFKSVLLAAGSRSIRLAYVRNTRATVSEAALRILCLDNSDVGAGLAPLIEDYAPDYVYGIPSFLMRVFDEARNVGTDSVRVVSLTGERMTPHLRDFFSAHFPAADRTMEYIVSEIGHIGASCQFLPSNQYHLSRGVEAHVAEPDEHGIGELVASKEEKSGVPVRDYRVGDTVRIVRHACACGQDVTLEHFGRSGIDYMKLHGAIIRREEFDRVAGTFRGRILDYRVVVGERRDASSAKGELRLEILLKGGRGTNALAQEFSRAFEKKVFATPTQTIADLISAGIFVPISVEFVDRAFVHKNKDVKLVRKGDAV